MRKMQNTRWSLLNLILLSLLAFAATCCMSLVASASGGISVESIRRAAEQGDAVAQIVLGNAYYQGEGVTQDHKQAFEWWRRAAEQPQHESHSHYQCPKCHHIVQAETLVCPSCGEHLKAHTSSETHHKSIRYRCPKCHHELDADATQCPGCGVHLKPHAPSESHYKAIRYRCPKCHHELDADTTQCPGCGVRLKPRNVSATHHLVAPTIKPISGHSDELTCQSCGKQYSRDFKFCPYCGTTNQLN